jgi:hypothetical protein
LGQKATTSKLITTEQALIIYTLKLQTHLTLMNELFQIEERAATYDLAFDSIRPMMIDLIYQKTGGIEWEEVEDRVIKIVQEQIKAGSE